MNRHDVSRTEAPAGRFVVVVRRGVQALLRADADHSAHRVAGRRRAAFGPGPALLVVTGFMVGSVAGVTLNQLDRDAARTAAVTARATLLAHDSRVATAVTERLSGQATAYFARRRTEAVDAAQLAVSGASLVRASAGPVIGDDALGPLDEAMTALAALVGSVPTAPTVLQTATATAAAERPAPTPTAELVAPTTPGADVISLVAQARLTRAGSADRGTAAAPLPTPVTVESSATGAPGSQHSPAMPTPQGPASQTVPYTATPSAVADLVPSTAGTTSAPATPTPAAQRPEGQVSLLSSSAVPGVSVTPPGSPTSLEAIFAQASVVRAQNVPAAAVAAAAASGLDVSVSNQILGLVDQIIALSVEVQVAADAVVAEQQAAAKAQAEAEAAAQQAAARAARTMRTRIAATNAAPNGEVPTILLCGVSFARAVLLRCDAATMLDRMDAAYHRETARHLTIVSSYRTTTEQGILRATKGELAALAGTSNHGRALAIDLADAGSVGQFGAPVYLWLVANAGTYGWHHPSYMEPGGAGPLEPWHWEYDTN